MSKRALAIALAAAVIAPTGAIAQSNIEGYAGPNNVVSGIDENPTPPTTGNEVPVTEDQAPTNEVAGNDVAENDVAGEVAGDEAASAPVESAQAGTLPFTGADLGVLTAAGLILLALGLGLRRLTQRPSGI